MSSNGVPMVNPFFEPEVVPERKGAKVVNFLQGFVIFIFVLIFIYLFIATPNQVEGNSMWPTFKDREIVLTYRLVGILGNSGVGRFLGVGYNYGDVIIMQKPGFNEFIKRVIGLPGDRIKIQNGRVYRNGNVIEEKYLASTVKTNTGDLFTEGTEIAVPDGTVVVMGDNRPGSYDSRFIGIGLVKMEWIKGRVLVRVWPPNKFGFIQHADYVYQADPNDGKTPPPLE